MKNKFLMAVIMLFFIGICCIPTNSYAVCPDIYGGCNWSSATCTKLATCSRCGDTKGGYASHSYGGYNVTKRETCTSDGWEVAYCSSCGKSTGRSRDALGHSMDSWYSITGYKHKRICARKCGYSETEDCNKANKVKKAGYDKYHGFECNVCGYDWPFPDFKEEHPGWSGGETSPHKCTDCGHVMEGNEATRWMQYHNYEGLTSGFVDRTSYYCGTCNEEVSILNGTYPDLHAKGLPASKYVASDATIPMDPIPEFPHATYTLYWKNGDSANPTLRDEYGNPVTPQVNPDDLKIYSWGRKNLKTHATKTKEYAKKAYDAQMELYGMAFFGNEVIGDSEEDLFKTFDMIDHDINRASNHEQLNWNGVLHEACMNVYKDGGTTYSPIVTQSGTRYEIKFEHPAGGWAVPPNKFLKMAYYLQDSLFKYGKVDEEPAVPWTANIYYCYRVLGRGTVPKNGYKALYTYKTVTVYNAGPIDVTVSIPADMNLIDKTGYRYVGVATQVSSVGNIRPASAPTSSASTGTVTVGWDYNRAAAIITFFVEPVKLSYGNKAVNYNGNIINIVAASHEGKGLEFPDYYDKSAGRCYIPVSASYSSSVIEPLESLNKFWWPGYILESSKVWKEGTTTVIRRK